MGQMIDEEDCEVCVPFDQEWIFTYGDLVTLLLCFFILLFSMCKLEVEKFKDVADSFKPIPPGSPYMLEGKDSVVEELAKEIEESELADDTKVNTEDRGVVVSFSARTFFNVNSSELTQKAKEELNRFARLIYLLPNKIQIEGHTDNSKPEGWSSNWELSGARASQVARYLMSAGLNGDKITVKGYANHRPVVRNDSPQQRQQNNRVEVIILPPSADSQ